MERTNGASPSMGTGQLPEEIAPPPYPSQAQLESPVWGAVARGDTLAVVLKRLPVHLIPLSAEDVEELKPVSS